MRTNQTASAIAVSVCLWGSSLMAQARSGPSADEWQFRPTPFGASFVLGAADGERYAVSAGRRAIVRRGNALEFAPQDFAEAIVFAAPFEGRWVFVTHGGAVATADTFLGAPQFVARTLGAYVVDARVVGPLLMVLDSRGELSLLRGGQWTTPTLPPVLDVRAFDDQHLLALCELGVMARSANGGQTWTYSFSERSQPMRFFGEPRAGSIAVQSMQQSWLRWTFDGPARGAPTIAPSAPREPLPPELYARFGGLWPALRRDCDRTYLIFGTNHRYFACVRGSATTLYERAASGDRELQLGPAAGGNRELFDGYSLEHYALRGPCSSGAREGYAQFCVRSRGRFIDVATPNNARPRRLLGEQILVVEGERLVLYGASDARVVLGLVPSNGAEFVVREQETLVPLDGQTTYFQRTLRTPAGEQTVGYLVREGRIERVNVPFTGSFQLGVLPGRRAVLRVVATGEYWYTTAFPEGWQRLSSRDHELLRRSRAGGITCDSFYCAVGGMLVWAPPGVFAHSPVFQPPLGPWASSARVAPLQPALRCETLDAPARAAGPRSSAQGVSASIRANQLDAQWDALSDSGAVHLSLQRALPARNALTPATDEPALFAASGTSALFATSSELPGMLLLDAPNTARSIRWSELYPSSWNFTAGTSAWIFSGRRQVFVTRRETDGPVDLGAQRDPVARTTTMTAISVLSPGANHPRMLLTRSLTPTWEDAVAVPAVASQGENLVWQYAVTGVDPRRSSWWIQPLDATRTPTRIVGSVIPTALCNGAASPTDIVLSRSLGDVRESVNGVRAFVEHGNSHQATLRLQGDGSLCVEQIAPKFTVASAPTQYAVSSRGSVWIYRPGDPLPIERCTVTSP